MKLHRLALWVVPFLCVGAAAAEESSDSADVLPGHSYLGHTFDEGPRQKAYLMSGMPDIKFPVTTQSSDCQAFINQGIGQLHGFWFFEAERSFRQAAVFDKECAAAYWGMALANIDNEKRSTGFIEQAVKRKDKASEREKLYIDALQAFIKTGSKKNKERHEAYTKALEQITYKFPEDIEARAFLALHLWKSRDASVPIQSYVAVNSLLDNVFRDAPMHPAHHYRIHLWDHERRENALDSAAKCGQSAAGIAHMWHMSGHIYSGLKRYDDACWQQEASARVDHAHMMRDRVMPDQIHNFAHNNEWLIRDLVFVGRAKDALELAKNMCELPRHPKYNTLDKKGSTHFGRLRLFEVLAKFELWDEALALAATPFLEPTDDDAEQLKRLRLLGTANYRRADVPHGDEILAEVKNRLQAKRDQQAQGIAEVEAKFNPPPTEEKKEPEKKPDAPAAAAEKPADKPEEGTEKTCEDAPAKEETKPTEKPAEEKKAEEKKDPKAAEKAKEEVRKKFEGKIKELEKAVTELEGEQAVAQGDFKKGLELLKKAGGVSESFMARVQLQAGDKEGAEKAIRKLADGRLNEVIPKAHLVYLLHQLDKKDDARKELETLRQWAGNADLGLPAFARLLPIIQEFGLPEDWRSPRPAATDVGVRPTLESLGPFRWQPSPAPDWTLKNAVDEPVPFAKFRGRPVVLLFFLGNGCLHCAEQLQAFSKVKKDFDEAGIDLLAVSSDDQAGLKTSIEKYDGGPLPIPLVSDPDLATFKSYRAFDDFENKPLHGTFVIDPQGLVRWQDISFEPFMDTKFLLAETKRLLGQGK